jgi:hypothetical protein
MPAAAVGGLVDLLKAEAQYLVVLGLFAGHPPAQIDVDQVDAVLFQLFAQGREDYLDEMIPFRVHVAEGGGDEDPSGSPGAGHAEFLCSPDIRVHRPMCH